MVSVKPSQYDFSGLNFETVHGISQTSDSNRSSRTSAQKKTMKKNTSSTNVNAGKSSPGEKMVYFRTKPCKHFFSERGCVKGSKCNFRHDKLEVEPVSSNATNSETSPREQRRRRPRKTPPHLHPSNNRHLGVDSNSTLAPGDTTYSKKTHTIAYRTIGGGVKISNAPTESEDIPSSALPTPLDSPPHHLPSSLTIEHAQLPPAYEDLDEATTTFYESSQSASASSPVMVPFPHSSAYQHWNSVEFWDVHLPLHVASLPFYPFNRHDPYTLHELGLAHLSPTPHRPMLPLPYPHPPLPGTVYWIPEVTDKTVYHQNPLPSTIDIHTPPVHDDVFPLDLHDSDSDFGSCGLHEGDPGVTEPLVEDIVSLSLPLIGKPITNTTTSKIGVWPLARPSSAPPLSPPLPLVSSMGDLHASWIRMSIDEGLCQVSSKESP
ncbi:hypothetical protein BDY19DRAFT_971723 [Irpex rosettiformis]|uniref:Uncharacterized protein n=1 Tax=Irpex rosettiformis TaxID=378272 RepID=A0ACB8TQS2_9APHY|nr:hypothetical protein BDY19DRAFT_971723 [Irpex rosettiformis]